MVEGGELPFLFLFSFIENGIELETCNFVLFLFVRARSILLPQNLQRCKKPSTVNLVKRLMYSNLLGLDASLKNGRYALTMHL